MARSLLDEADLSAVRAAAGARPGAAGVVLACLLEGGALAHATDDPDWADRDRLVVGSAALAAAVVEAGGPVAVDVVAGGGALGLAAGLAAASVLDGGVSRVFCLLGEDALDDGLLWEGALAATGPTLVAVLLVGSAAEGRARALLEAAGWRTASASATEPLEVLGALDRVQRDGQAGPGAVLAVGA